MKSITIEKSTNSIVNRITYLKENFDVIINYIKFLENENDRFKQDNSRLYAENSSLRKELDLKKRKEESFNDLDDVYKKLKELRIQKIKFEEEFNKCMEYVQNQYDDLK